MAKGREKGSILLILFYSLYNSSIIVCIPFHVRDTLFILVWVSHSLPCSVAINIGRILRFYYDESSPDAHLCSCLRAEADSGKGQSLSSLTAFSSVESGLLVIFWARNWDGIF